MEAEIIQYQDYWKINFYNNLGELIDCYYVVYLTFKNEGGSYEGIQSSQNHSKKETT